MIRRILAAATLATSLVTASAAAATHSAPSGAPTGTSSSRATMTLTGNTVANYPPEPYAAALARQALTMGNPETIRYFYGSSPLRWPPSGGFAGTRPMVVSFNRSPAR
ncbi:MAG: hypothetical protein LCH77_07195 [Actinobacteria bacterium]|nr:hypothetical protein [Actinomycetota bacterium]